MRLYFLISVLLLTSCFGGGHYAPVIERKDRLKGVPKSHFVNRGDTLYSIAWLYNLDFRGLARTNNIAPPYTIYPGQEIRLTVMPATQKTATTSSQKSLSKAPPPKTKQAIAKVPAKTAVSKEREPKKVSSPAVLSAWRWPAKNKIVRGFTPNSSVHQGIDIQGNLGEPVYAANSGNVVYAGSGLVGFGNLLILKHGDRYLSAYGHNSKLLVVEGERIKVGQKIAEFGNSGTDTVKLHFEVRRDGKPLNPISVLPKRK